MPLEAKADALIGTILEGRFQIERLLGEGGMGRVYVADETRLRRRCALKVLLPELTQDKECVERFLREAQAIAQIHHENVVDIYHLGEDTEKHVVFFAMELLTGEDLETRLLDRKQRPLGWQQVCQWMAQVAAAMAAVHAAGMIHRDLKPSNIFIARRRDGRDQIKLLDFGIAKLAHHTALTSTGAAIGTPFYMSPEQILTEPLDPRTDIYSLGSLFYEAVAGRMPFAGEPIQVAMQHCNVPPQPIAVVAPTFAVPPELDALILRMMAKRREDRPQTMEEIEALLTDFFPNPALHNSGLHRPITGKLPTNPPRPGSGASTSQVSPADAIARTQAFHSGITPASPQNHPPAARTNLDPLRPPSNTVEIHLDADSTHSTKKRTGTFILLGVLFLGLAITALSLLRHEDPPPSEQPSELQVQPPPDHPILTLPPHDPQHSPDTAGTTDDPKAPKPGETKPGETKPGETKPGEGKSGEGKSGEGKSGEGKSGEGKASDPMAQLKKAAAACRKQHKAPKEPKITIDYGVGSDGSVNRTVAPSGSGELGLCLIEALKKVKFPPKFVLGQKISL